MDKGRNVLDSTGVNVPMGSIANLIIIVHSLYIKFSQVFAKEVKDFQKSDRDKKHKEGDPPNREKEDKENLMETGWFTLQQQLFDIDLLSLEITCALILLLH